VFHFALKIITALFIIKKIRLAIMGILYWKFRNIMIIIRIKHKMLIKISLFLHALISSLHNLERINPEIIPNKATSRCNASFIMNYNNNAVI
jgi:hypothetical protein